MSGVLDELSEISASSWCIDCKVDLTQVGGSGGPATQQSLRPGNLCRDPSSLVWALPGTVRNIACCIPATVVRKQVPRLLSGKKRSPWRRPSGSGVGFPIIPVQLACGFLSAHSSAPHFSLSQLSSSLSACLIYLLPQ